MIVHDKGKKKVFPWDKNQQEDYKRKQRMKNLGLESHNNDESYDSDE